MAWLALGGASGHAPALPGIEALLASSGRMKFLKPLYLALAIRPETRERAGALFRRHRDRYHPIARRVIEEVLRAHQVVTHDVNPLGLRRRP